MSVIRFNPLALISSTLDGGGTWDIVPVCRQLSRTLSDVEECTLGRGPMNRSVGASTILLFVIGAACSQPPERPSASEASAGIDSLNLRLVQAYRTRDPQEYGALYTDSAVFEWPAFNTVRGRAGLETMARSNWASLDDMDLQLIVSSRRVASNHATEFGAFQQSYRDPKGLRMTEFGRYVTVLARQPDGSWRIDRFFGFADSTRPLSTRP
jgi:ketosteroid isomerase-like protein